MTPFPNPEVFADTAPDLSHRFRTRGMQDTQHHIRQTTLEPPHLTMRLPVADDAPSPHVKFTSSPAPRRNEPAFAQPVDALLFSHWDGSCLIQQDQPIQHSIEARSPSGVPYGSLPAQRASSESLSALSAHHHAVSPHPLQSLYTLPMAHVQAHSTPFYNPLPHAPLSQNVIDIPVFSLSKLPQEASFPYQNAHDAVLYRGNQSRTFKVSVHPSNVLTF